MKRVLRRAPFPLEVKVSGKTKNVNPGSQIAINVCKAAAAAGFKNGDVYRTKPISGKQTSIQQPRTLLWDGKSLTSLSACIHKAVQIGKQLKKPELSIDLQDVAVRQLREIEHKSPKANGGDVLFAPTMFLAENQFRRKNSIAELGYPAATKLATSLVTSTYKYDRLQSKPKKTTDAKSTDLKNVTINFAGGNKNFHRHARKQLCDVEVGRIIGEAVNDARNLGNLREDEGTPEFYVDWAKEFVCKGNNNTKLKDLLVGKELESKGLNLFYGVGKQSIHKPALAVMEHKGAKNDSESICLVGKGVTFDSGGMNVKPFGNMELMHMDMMGAAAVLATMRAVKRLNLPINVVGVVGLCENAIGPDALQPSSIVTSLKGSTVEITNTDAEGRLVLADCLTYVQKHSKITTNPSTIIDLATLTGAMLIALGSTRAGAFGNDKQLLQDLYTSGCEVNEHVWPMPIGDEHNKMIKGNLSDIVNCVAGREAGACTAAAFLKHFVEKGNKWVHLDIAGPGMGTKGKGLNPDGAPGFGVQLLMRYLLRQVQVQQKKVGQSPITRIGQDKLMKGVPKKKRGGKKK